MRHRHVKLFRHKEHILVLDGYDSINWTISLFNSFIFLHVSIFLLWSYNLEKNPSRRDIMIDSCHVCSRNGAGCPSNWAGHIAAPTHFKVRKANGKTQSEWIWICVDMCLTWYLLHTYWIYAILRGISGIYIVSCFFMYAPIIKLIS